MAVRQAAVDGHSGDLAQPFDGGSEAVTVVVRHRRDGIEVTEHDRLLSLQDTGMQQLVKQPLDLIGGFVNVFYNEDAAADTWKKTRAQQCGEHHEVAAPQPARVLACGSVKLHINLVAPRADDSEEVLDGERIRCGRAEVTGRWPRETHAAAPARDTQG